MPLRRRMVLPIATAPGFLEFKPMIRVEIRGCDASIIKLLFTLRAAKRGSSRCSLELPPHHHK
ncbi:hypothetical protein C1I60_04855 [Paenibacillus terrae]|uniref:Uncharacterized protein n=1 Tax=Paenibacillus terrae TaxID=159743 RepID=A0A4U2Q7G4_9BACL|nr:hypothetical protein C1I60_04855 [Paenibacillus terrae]